VSTNSVGLFIRRLVSFECSLFKLFFHLWGGGGPNWHAEFAAYVKEEENSWTFVAPLDSSASTRPGVGSVPAQNHSFADVVRAQSPPLMGANRVPIKPVSGANRVRLGSSSGSAPCKSVFRRIEFPSSSMGSRSFASRKPPISGRDKVKNQSVNSLVHLQHFKSARCSRFLSSSHTRFSWGHVAAACLQNLNSNSTKSIARGK
jgi:hypothetical protein